MGKPNFFEAGRSAESKGSRNLRSSVWFGPGLAALAAVMGVTAGAKAQWTQWGGPNMDFVAKASGLASSWPESGPKKLWSRDLGDGYSAILSEGDRLYTMYRVNGQESVICLNSKSGETVWEHRYDSSPRPGHVSEFGEGPRATPLLLGDKLYTIGIAGMMHCLEKATGKVVWSHDLWTEFKGNVLNHGYSSSPIVYKDTIITLVGGAGASVVAFNRNDGKVVWQSGDFANSYSTARVLKINGEDQLVTFMATEVIGMDPSNGNLKWKYAHENQWKQNVSMPIMVDDVLFISASEAGSRGLKLTKNGDKSDVSEVWSSRKVQFYHVNTLRLGDYIYGSSGANAPHFMMAVNAKTGEIAWRERGYPKANCIIADGKVVMLDEDGNAALATLTPKGLTVHSKAQLLDKVSWTVPTISGKTLYVRDKKVVAAFDLG